MKNKELSNLFLDISEEILNKLKSDNFLDAKNDQLLFLVCIENRFAPCITLAHGWQSNERCLRFRT